jgi:hypothetical protein
MLLIKSEISPKFNIAPFSTTIVWNPLDSTTAKGKSENNKLKAETAAAYVGAGIISTEEDRKRLINDPESGYNGLLSTDPLLPDPFETEEPTESPNESGEQPNAPAIPV